ncbi:MAG: hypothetical protein ACXWEY_03365 [Bacteroidia bacterium]
MYKKLLAAALVICMSLSITNLQAQSTENEDTETLKHSIGAGAGFTTGYGLSYRYRPGKFGGQINFAPYSNNDVSRYSAGLTFLYTIIENKVSNLYLYQGNHFYYNSQLEWVYDPTSSSNSRMERVTESYLNNGLGFGIELIVAKRVGINLMAGYAGYRNFSQLNITGEGALYYKF